MEGGCEGPGENWQNIAVTIREEIARRRMSRQMLADQARISLSTLEKALAGKRSFTLATLVRIESALGMNLRTSVHAPAIPSVGRPEEAGFSAPIELGGYVRKAVTWLEGSYLTIRPGFSDPATVYAYLTTIVWDDATARLRFFESARQDAQFSQCGEVSLPYLSNHIYLVTNEQGQFRTMVLGRPSAARVMHGILTTLQAGEGTQLTPVACPIALRMIDGQAVPNLGIFNADAPQFADYRGLLDFGAHHGFSRFVS